MSERKWSPAQKAVLDALAAGQTLVCDFDVWSGSQWFLSPSGKGVAASTATVLRRQKAIAETGVKRPFSGRRNTLYGLAERGRTGAAP